MKTSIERHASVDALRVLAILAVVAIHTSTRTIEAVNGSIDTLPFSFLINQLSRFAVPLFFMISGYVLELTYPNHQNYLTYIKKRFNKIFLPYVVWSAIYYLFIYTEHSVNFLEALIGGNASYQLYFIPTLLIFYIIFPLLHELYSILSNRVVIFALIVLQFIFLSRDYYIHPLPLFYPLDIALLNYAFFIVGMIASHNQTYLFNFIKKKYYFITAILLMSATVVCTESRILYISTKNYLDYYSSWRPSIFVYTISLGMLLYYLFEKTKRFNTLVHMLSKLSFFVFFIHVAILELFWSMLGRHVFYAQQTAVDKMFFSILFFLIVTIFSYSVAWLVHKIPHIYRITG